jgi:dolichol kinase
LLLLASLVVLLLFEKYIAITLLLFAAIGNPVTSLVGDKYGKFSEALPIPLDDNFTMPLLSAGGMALAALDLG